MKNKETGICKTCLKEFLKTSTIHKYCSESCRLAQQRLTNRFCILKRDKFTCVYCGKSSIEDGVKLAVDHVVPRNSGGKSEASNLVTCCLECNSQKSWVNLDVNLVDRLKKEIIIRNNNANIHHHQIIKLSGENYYTKEL